MATDFKAVHKQIKDHLGVKGYKYLTADKWFNFELGAFPAAAHNNAYTIKPGMGKPTEKYESATASDIPWRIEYCFAGVNDAYLKGMGAVYDAVASLEDLSANSFVEVEFLGFDWQNFEGHVIMTFDIIVTMNN